jgi:hypothetical protein
MTMPLLTLVLVLPLHLLTLSKMYTSFLLLQFSPLPTREVRGAPSVVLAAYAQRTH